MEKYHVALSLKPDAVGWAEVLQLKLVLFVLIGVGFHVEKSGLDG